MADKSTELFFEDRFARGDNSTVGNGWTETEKKEIVNSTVIDNSTSASGYISRSASAQPHSKVGSEYVVMAKVAGNIGSSSDSVTLSVVGRSNSLVISGGDFYMAELVLTNTGGTEAATLSIQKSVASSAENLSGDTVVTAEMNSVSSSFSDVFQTLALRIRDGEDGVILEAYLNDEERPRLTYTDQKYPLHQSAGNVGVVTRDSNADNRITYFALIGIQDLQEDSHASPNFFTFSKLKEILRARALRDSSSLVDTGYFGDLLNEALFEICNYIGRPYWLEDFHDFSTVSGKESVELPSDTLFVDDVVWDRSSSLPIPIINEEQFRRNAGRLSSGVPTAFRLSGSGPQGGPLLKAYPAPSSSRSYSVRRFRMPRYMTTDGDLPDLPQQFAYALLWGALVSYSMRDSDRTHIQAASAKFQSWLRRIRIICRRRDRIADKGAITSGLSGIGLGNTLWTQAKYGGWRWRG
jgi:hypothetical protein